MSISKVTQLLLERSRAVIDNADFLSVAVANQDKNQIEDAFDDLLAAYDNYAGRAATYTGRFSFDEVAKLETPEARDQGAADGLASALVDLEMALVLTRSAQAVGEIEGEASADDIDESVTMLSKTINAFQGVPSAVPGLARLAFDEVIATKAEAVPASPDFPAAKEAFITQVKEVYDELLTETTSLLVDMFKEVSGLDVDQIKKGLNVVKGTIETTAIGRAIQRILDALQRAVKTVKDLIGSEGLKKVDEYVTKIINEIKKGENVLQLFLKHSYQYDQGQQTISVWLENTKSDIHTIDGGTKRLGDLYQQVVQTFTVSKKIISNLRLLSGPIKWVVKKVVGTAPLDLLLAGLYFLIANAALLRAMDYADTTTLIKFVDGTLTISRQTLCASD